MAETNSVDMDDIAVCMLTFNEAQFIEVVLRAIKNYFPLFVLLDMGSTDDTLAIAKDTIGDALRIMPWGREKFVCPRGLRAPATI